MFISALPPLLAISATETAAVDWLLWTNIASTDLALSIEFLLLSIIDKVGFISFIFRNYIIIGVTSSNLGCNSILIEDGEFVLINKLITKLELKMSSKNSMRNQSR